MDDIETIKLRFRAGHHEEALAACADLVAARPSDPEPLRLNALMNGLMGRFAASAAQLDALLVLDPNDLEARYNLAVCQRESGQLERALEA